MKILLTGANGFIGGHILSALRVAGHEVVAAVRNPDRFPRLEKVTVIRADMNRDVSPADWAGRLDGVDAVINCAGILQQRHGQSIWAIHRDAPVALFKACDEAGIGKVIQISAIGTEAATDYAASKKAADDYLQAGSQNWVILRPSLVYAQGSYGGTSMLRALAVMPFFVPVIGSGEQCFTPIHADDLARLVVQALETDGLDRRIIEPCGPENIELADLVMRLRRWLGIRGGHILRVPRWLVGLGAWFGDRVGVGPLTSTSLAQLDFGTDADPRAFRETIGWEGRRLDDALAQNPAQVQDRLHARLYNLRPLVWISLIVLWLWSGMLGFLTDDAFVARYGDALGLGAEIIPWVGPVTGLWDLVLAGLVLARYKVVRTGALQLATIAAYTAGITFAQPDIWLDPFGSLLKNIPILVLILIWMVLEDER
ncbi:NAD(P)H-binding protein [Aestuariispira insulae]|uniref:Uncharacterized protein YbjT (DUF2867 family) n=1 Tax=Aestuariispira insulae TaxID=1461337 RepID=A0A3D9HXP9_9PROT|nr:NAD(P)H-binding protein [Aestuariispira insulae]RED54278.1 uncharacterized protein YbjT (DUF2867 family) [Aestuariispira insulae]